MNSRTHHRSTVNRAGRAPSILVIAALAVALAACHTPPEGAVDRGSQIVPVPVPGPPAVDLGRTADRIADQQEGSATTGKHQNEHGWSDRLVAQLHHQDRIAELEFGYRPVPADPVRSHPRGGSIPARAE